MSHKTKLGSPFAASQIFNYLTMWRELANSLLALAITVLFIVFSGPTTKESLIQKELLQWNFLFHAGDVPIYKFNSEK